MTATALGQRIAARTGLANPQKPVVKSNTSIPGFPMGQGSKTLGTLQIPEKVIGGQGGIAAAVAQPDARDPQYWNSLTDIENKYSVGTARLATESAQDQLATQRAMTILGEQLPKDYLTAKRSANRSGLFYSTGLSNQLGDLELNNSRGLANLREGLAGRQANRAISKTELTQSYGPGGTAYGQALGDAVSRNIDRDAALGLSAPQAPPVQGPTAATGMPKSLATQIANRNKVREVLGYDSKGNAGTWHYYPDGRKVFVKGKLK